MRPIEDYLEYADELAQEVVNAWGLNTQAGNAATLTDDFKAVFDKACWYREAKRVADNRREFKMSSAADAATEQAMRQTFAEAYKIFWEKRQAAA